MDAPPSQLIDAPEVDWTTERLNSLMVEQRPEDYRFDYKGKQSVPALPVPKEKWPAKREEIGKDVSAFANSDGGTLIYGIAEKKEGGRSIPSEFQPIDSRLLTPEGLMQIIADNVGPTVLGIRVFPVNPPGEPDSGMVCYVVVVPKSTTAHMASDGRYYFRNETVTGRMRDWQVADTMNRSKRPDVSAKLKLWKNFDPHEGHVMKAHLAITNNGTIICRDYAVHVVFPLTIGGTVWEVPDGIVVSTEKGHGLELRISNHNKGPLFPSMTAYENFTFTQHQAFSIAGDQKPLLEEFLLTVFGDSMPAKQNWLRWDKNLEDVLDLAD